MPRNTVPKPRLMPSGYVRVWCPGHPVANKDGYALEHRKVLHDAGVELPARHHVHHVNGDKADNRIENLQVKPVEDHIRDHALAAGVVVNQHGTFKVAQTEEERLERRREIGRENQRKRRARLKAKKRWLDRWEEGELEDEWQETAQDHSQDDDVPRVSMRDSWDG